MPEDQGNQAVVNSEAGANTAVTEPTPVASTPSQDASASSGNEAPQTQDTQVGQSDDGEIHLIEETQPPETPKPDESTEGDDQLPKKGADARKDQLNQNIRSLVAETHELEQQKQRLASQVEQINAQVYQPPSYDDLPTIDDLMQKENPNTGEFYTHQEAQIERLLGEQQVNEQVQKLNSYNQKVSASTYNMSVESEKALSDFPWSDPQNQSEYDAEIAPLASKLLAENIVFDPNTGHPIGVNQPIYDIYKTIDVARQSGIRLGEAKGQQSVEQMLSSADNMGAGVRSERAFNQLSTEQMEANLRKKGHDV
ncbi:hypothetical protein I8H89_00335 [Candidatus Saccharibacteria bacterium]|nr:hypothetical protein [Candidatus Saccharibacteria bacterium]